MRKSILLILSFFFYGAVLAQWNTSGSNVYYEDGNVGIGTTAPSNVQGWNKVLDVHGQYHSKILATINDQSVKAGIFAHNSSWYGGGGFIGTESNHNLFFLTGYNAKMMISTDGNVGIGTTSPVAKLTIGSYPGSAPTTNGIALGEDHNHLEFLNSSYGLGYGAKLYGVDQGYGLTSFRLAVRGNSTTWTDALFVRAADNGVGGGNLGYVGIGTNDPDARLTVKGHIHAEEVRVDLNVPGPDYVFEENYNLLSLSEIEAFIKQNKHLPEVPSAKEMEQNGINLSEMNMLLLKKVEELTLYVIELKKENENLKNRVYKIENK
jgi:hypothetical protein